ncbi:hypothetical protein RJ640_006076 [Escallonia rubra]|uniref:Diacylglycerol kinase accessory domain-containing protein n=1 Tax=Escallonia rubra TaxID=112253 RepID=A0AA88UVI7_9ASTE|nr:hypothetical protein RJ640_006076 [Escallonia rubra]
MNSTSLGWVGSIYKWDHHLRELIDGSLTRSHCLICSIRAILCLNLPSFSGGLNPWGIPNNKGLHSRDFSPLYVDDGLNEVVGFQNILHGLVLFTSKGHGTRLAQARKVRFEFKKDAVDHTYMRIDGEPWKQPLPMDDDSVVIEISHSGRVSMLANPPCPSKSIKAPPSSYGPDEDEDDSNADLEDNSEGRSKLDAAETLRSPEGFDDITHQTVIQAPHDSSVWLWVM